MPNTDKEYLERIIEMQQKQLQMYDEYMKMFISKGHMSSPKTTTSSEHHDNLEQLLPFIKNNLVCLDKQTLLSYFEDRDTTYNCLISLIEHVLVPDKEHPNFIIQSVNSVKYKNNENIVITENFKDFSNKVCDVIYEHCYPYINSSDFEQLHSQLLSEDSCNDESVTIDLEKTQVYTKNISQLKFSETQMRLVKKVFSMLKHK